MEFFGFASGTSNTGPFFPFLPESILKNYPSELMDHPALPGLPEQTAAVYETVSSVDFTSFAKSIAQATTSFLEKPYARQIGIGLLATAFAYSVWKISLGWNESINLGSSSEINFDFEVQKLPTFDNAEIQSKMVPMCAKNNKHESLTTGDGGGITAVAGDGPPKVTKRRKQCPLNKKTKTERIKSEKPKSSIPAPKVDQKESLEPEPQTPKVVESETPNVEQESKARSKRFEEFQSQLVEALSRLDDVKLKLKELEGEKDILGAEVDLRKKIIQKLQDDNTLERDKRQEAELKMEMMEIENVQLRQLRKEVALKAGQIERLEKFLREREELQEKLFQDYVVLPRVVAETRVKEFDALRARIHKLESDLGCNESLREIEVKYQVSRSSSTLKNEEQVCPSDQNLSAVPPLPDPNLNSEKSSKSGQIKSNNHPSGKSRKSAQKLCDKPEKSKEEKEQDVAVLDHSKMATATSCSDNATSATEYFTEKSESQKGVFAQFKALIGGFSESSSESDIANESEPVRILKGLVSQSDDKDNNNLDGYPLSDGQSSVFMSASSGPVSSEEEMDLRISDKEANKTTKSRSPKKLTRHERDMAREKEKSKCKPNTSLPNHESAGSNSILEDKPISLEISHLEQKHYYKSSPPDHLSLSRSITKDTNESHDKDSSPVSRSSTRSNTSISILGTTTSSADINYLGHKHCKSRSFDIRPGCTYRAKDTNGSHGKDKPSSSQCSKRNDAKDINESHDAQSSSAGSGGENDAESEDSWIVIMPAVG